MRSLLIIALSLSFFLSGCAVRYAQSDFLGKTSVEIASEYGDFDCVTMSADEDGLYKNCRCGYTLKAAQTGFFGQSDEVLFFIQFDGSGIAVNCSQGSRPGG